MGAFLQRGGLLDAPSYPRVPQLSLTWHGPACHKHPSLSPICPYRKYISILQLPCPNRFTST